MLTNFHVVDLGDLGVFRRGGAQGIFSKITLSVRSNEKDEVCHSFLVKIFTKSLHRGGVSTLEDHTSSFDYKAVTCLMFFIFEISAF